MAGIIKMLNGVPHEVTSQTLWSEPIELTHWWPLPSAAGIAQEGDVVLDGRDGWVLVTTSFGPKRFMLAAGGATTPTRVDERPVARPATKLKTRWRNGGWEKRTRRGWTAA